MKKEQINSGSKMIMFGAVLISISIVFFAVINTKDNTKPKTFYDKFAQCLTEKGAIMYGAVWCEHCKEQKKVFSDSFKYIKYVECPENEKLCIDKGVQGYPTWIMGETIIEEGFNKNTTMKKLASSTGCELPQ